jgi:xyloglucan galactosyltransferase MUR3
MVCCVLWMVLVLAPLPPELVFGRGGSVRVSTGEIVGTMERRDRDTPPAPGSGEMSFPAVAEHEKIMDMSPPSSKKRRARPETPPMPAREQIVDASRSPPPPEDDMMKETPPLMNRDGVIVASPPPPHPQPKTESPPSRQARQERPEKVTAVADLCAGRYIYIQDLPSRFNADLLRDCRTLSSWMDMCKHVDNAGMGPRLTRTGGALPSTGWYDTNQFTLEVIFHSRMRRYGCLTSDAARAAAVYVPYYAGLDVGRHLWEPFGNAARDALAEDLVAFLRASPAWQARGGRDHFLVAGRVAWDFRREAGSEWGNRLLLLPEARNVTALVLESGPWHAASDVAVPYPTSLHPSRAAEVAAWQRTVRRARRSCLFAFAGAPRPGTGSTATLRDALIDQCTRSRRCKLLQCGGHGRRDGCRAPGSVVRLFKSAAFCLQPPGDSLTRRSAFDAMLAGCVPVFFHPGSAYAQYRWHLPANHASYSVFVPEDGVRNGSLQLEDVLRRFGRAQVAAMREQVVRLIPRIVYRDPRAGAEGFRDAFDIAIDGVIERVARIKRGLPPEEEDGNVHKWDAYFDRR